MVLQYVVRRRVIDDRLLVFHIVGILELLEAKEGMLKFLICRVELNGNSISSLDGTEIRFLNGHTRSVTFVGMDKLNKTLVSAGSDGLVLVYFLQYFADLSYGISRQLQ